MTRTTDPPIRCRGLTVGYPGQPVISDITLSVDAGTTVALAGPSGCGKTTFIKTLAGILDPIAGEATVLGTRLPGSVPAGQLGYIPQSLGLLPHETVLRNVLHGTLAELGAIRSLFGRFPPTATDAARQAIAAVGLGELTNRRINQLSGGQRRRVAIARAVVRRPTILLADEILSELDPTTAQSIIDLLDQLQERSGMTVILVEHDPDLAASIADSIIRLDGEDGRSPHEKPMPTSTPEHSLP